MQVWNTADTRINCENDHSDLYLKMNQINQTNNNSKKSNKQPPPDAVLLDSKYKERKKNLLPPKTAI